MTDRNEDIKHIQSRIASAIEPFLFEQNNAVTRQAMLEAAMGVLDELVPLELEEYGFDHNINFDTNTGSVEISAEVKFAGDTSISNVTVSVLPV